MHQDPNAVSTPPLSPASDTRTVENVSEATLPNILVFGETGVGKSSLINMLAGPPYNITQISSEAVGHTFTNVQHHIVINDTQVVAWDTAGLNEGEHGTMSTENAMHNLQRLVENLSSGLSLLVYCIRGSRFREIWKVNYDVFVAGICRGKVPVVLVVAGCENESPTMENWWTENEQALRDHGLDFKGHACITSSRGKKLRSGEHMFEEEYRESETVVRELILNNLMTTPWVADKTWTEEFRARFSGSGLFNHTVSQTDAKGNGSRGLTGNTTIDVIVKLLSMIVAGSSRLVTSLGSGSTIKRVTAKAKICSDDGGGGSQDRITPETYT